MRIDFLQIRNRPRGGAVRREGRVRNKKIEMFYINVPIPHKECHH